MSLLDPPLVPADDRGILLGDGIFETLRLYGGRPFQLEAHLRRLAEGAVVLGILLPGGVEGVRSIVVRALSSWRGGDGALRITLTRGGGPGLAPPEDPEPRLLISLAPIPRGLEKGGSPLRAILAGRLEERSLTAGIKGTAYLERIQALRLARRRGADEALLRNSKGRIVEGSASNLFAVREGKLIAPGKSEGALPGITREVVLGLAAEAGVEAEERGVARRELPGLSELFLTSSIRELVPVGEVEGRLIGGGEPGEIFTRLAHLFRAAVREETGEG